MSKIPFIFFGTSEFSVEVLDTLKNFNYLPETIISTPDQPQGRGLELEPTPTKVWANIHNIPVLQPVHLDSEFLSQLQTLNCKLFIVASYGKIIPKEVFELPEHKTLNVHPSLLPKLRGASPIQNTILQGEKIGVTIMQISEKMDEGPIIAQEEVILPDVSPDNPPRAEVLETILAKHGGEMLVRIIPDWVEGKIDPKEQDRTKATYCKKIDKTDAELDLEDDALTNLRKVRAYCKWPGAYLYFTKKNGEKVRVIVREAEIIGETFSPTRVVPAGKKEMDYTDFLRGNQ